MAEFGLGAWSHKISDFGSKGDIEKHADRLSDVGLDLLIPCVKNPHGAVDFRTALADVDPSYPDWDPLRSMIDACHERGIKVHPWFCVFPEGENSRLLREHPEYKAVFEGTLRWACACRPQVQDYVFGLYQDLARRYRPDGLHLDYIRTGGLCRCGYCGERMKAEGIDIETVEARDPAFERWTDWRVTRMNEFVGRVKALAKGLNMEVSAAVFASYPDSLRGQGQDWVRWAEEGLVDYLFPMNYTNSERVAATRTLCHVALVGGKVPIWEGLGKSSSASQLTAKALSDQMEGVLAAGADGVVLFQYRSLTDDDIAAIRELRANM